MPASLSESSVIMNTSADQNPGSGHRNIVYYFFGEPIRDTWLSTIVVCFMIVTCLALFWFPLKRIPANLEINYNEGWNAYQAARVANGIPLYRTPPGSFGTGTGYPPLSFHLISLLGTSTTFTVIGRWISLISLLMTGVFVALMVRLGGASLHAVVFSFLLYEIGIAILLPDRIGMNDPQLLAEALSTAGLYFYLRNPVSSPFLCLSALLFCLGGFTKQTMLAFPAAVAIDLLLKSRRAFAVWAAAMLVSAGSLMGLTYWSDGPYLLRHLTGAARTYSYHLAWSQFHHYVLNFQTLLVIATAWSICMLRSRFSFVAAFVMSHLLAFSLAGGFGVDMNIFFNPLAATVIVCGIAVSEIALPRTDLRVPLMNSAAALMFGLFAISIMIFVPGQLRRNRQQLRLLPAHASEFHSAVELLKTRPGPALCESHLLCYEAGKPFEYEPFSVQEQLETGLLREDDVFQLVRTHHFQAVEIALREDEEKLNDGELRASLTSDQKEPGKQRRFTQKFMNELLENYQLSLRTSEMAVFCPK
ncbi:MAG TPA: hypothetical protein VFN26_18870 [Candidatus Acidoferrum sp.]|nr:hypothetical protein [Candidatus Acidoferrum sp.]